MRFVRLVVAAGSFAGVLLPVSHVTASTEAVPAAASPTGAESPIALIERGRGLARQGKFAEAEPLFATAVRQLRPDATQARGLGVALRERGVALGYLDRLAEAEPVLLEAVSVLEAAAGANDPETLSSTMHLASLYAYTGRVELAEPRLRRVVAAHAAAGIKSTESVEALAGLGGAMRELGQYAEAEELQRRAVAHAEEVAGPDSAEAASALNQLGATLRFQGRHADVLPISERILRIREKVFPPTHPNVIVQRGNHAILLGEVGRFAEAEAMVRELIAWTAANKGKDSAYYAYYPKTLARILHQAGRDEEARALAEESRAIFERAVAAGRREFETDAVAELARTYFTLARIYVVLGQGEAGRELVRAARPGMLDEFRRTLSYTSEPQRLAFLRTTAALDLAANLGDAEGLAEDSARIRGIVFDSMLEDIALARASQDPAIAALAARHRQALKSAPAGGASDAGLAGQLNEIEEIERQLAQHRLSTGEARRALTTSAAEVRRALQPDEALIEFIRYRRYLPRSKTEVCYGALVATADDAPRWIALGAASEIDSAVARYQQLMREEGDAAWLDELAARITAPVLAVLPERITKLRVSPEGALHGVSFAALPLPVGGFVGTQREITYVSSGRDLLPGKTALGKAEFAIVAAPEFGAAPTLLATTSTNERQELVRGLRLRPLPGAGREAEQLARLAGSTGDGDRRVVTNVRRFVGVDATEAQLEALHSPRWLHFATHGFFLPDLANDTRRSPMHRAGLALANAKVTLAAWNEGRAPDPSRDGILTAAEACALDLAGTELVVLSACDSGTGFASAGEGVLGLKRGFARAGARHLLLALWEVPDNSTPAIMTDFYRELFAGASPASAWATTQREWLRRVAAERGPVVAARTVGPWVMNERR